MRRLNAILFGLMLVLAAFLIGVGIGLADTPPSLLLKMPKATVLMQGGRNDAGDCVVKVSVMETATHSILMDGLVACDTFEQLLRMTRGQKDV